MRFICAIPENCILKTVTEAGNDIIYQIRIFHVIKSKLRKSTGPSQYLKPTLSTSSNPEAECTPMVEATAW